MELYFYQIAFLMIHFLPIKAIHFQSLLGVAFKMNTGMIKNVEHVNLEHLILILKYKINVALLVMILLEPYVRVAILLGLRRIIGGMMEWGKLLLVVWIQKLVLERGLLLMKKQLISLVRNYLEIMMSFV